MQSHTSNTVSKQTLNDLDNIDIITSPSGDDHTNNKSPPSSSSSSNESPTVSQVSPLPHIIKKQSTGHHTTHILKNINHPQSIHENLPVTPTTNTSTPHLSTNSSQTQSQVHFNNTIIIYDTPTQTKSNPSNQQNYLDTPNLFHLTPSNDSTMPSSVSQTIPPLTLSATPTLTLSYKDST